MRKSDFLIKVLSDPKAYNEMACKFPDFYYVAIAVCNLIGELFAAEDIVSCDVEGDDSLLEGDVSLILDLGKKECKEVYAKLSHRAKGGKFGIKKYKYTLSVSGKDNILRVSYCQED